MSFGPVTDFLDKLVSDSNVRALWESGQKAQAIAASGVTGLTPGDIAILENGPLNAVDGLVKSENPHGRAVEESTTLRVYGWIK
jgi:hypothetical protein